MTSCIGMAAASSLTRLARVDSTSLRFSPLPSQRLPQEKLSIFPVARVSASFRGGRSGGPFLFSSSYTHLSGRVFSIAPKTTDQTSGSEVKTPRRSSWISICQLFRMVLKIIGFIVGLSSPLLGFLRKEERVLNEIEEDIDTAADFVKVAAKGIKEVAEGLEKISEVVEKDAETVDTVMDKVKEDTKTVHDEVENAIGMLEGLSQGVQAKAAEETQVASEV